ncbi:7-cyano-7-deazaguanine synthase [Chitinivibrio alkaliphilus]|uniref:Thiamine biosynthesis protein ThiI n=1 Tax=Chitinivibrio alkaliphilus ACht1 TaxID=1313304 RepID=U7DBC5_9BACT|nr:7-cyano-7-deazaguanine synthase [Chitinivibrio alkaliphilus]ERP39312.1 thiamine biosynthesis protein ThiI [Chitinivibrio alkaliphilus ACht1]
MNRQARCLVLFSGGLDSVVAAQVMKEQGVEVELLHFVLPFDSYAGNTHESVRTYAEQLHLPLHILMEGAEFLTMVRENHYGTGSAVNPCIDCRIFRLRRAKQYMKEHGFDFLVTGEVVGQRPMSQRLELMPLIEEQADLHGLLLRPLSAQYLEPTIPEKEGWVDRKSLFAISGRSRKMQQELLRKYDLRSQTPGGGCILTEKEFARRYHYIEKNFGMNLLLFQLLSVGRYVLVSKEVCCIVGRDDRDNQRILAYLERNDASYPTLRMAHTEGPLGVLISQIPLTKKLYEEAGAILARYSKERQNTQTEVLVDTPEGSSMSCVVTPASSQFCQERLL